MALALSDGGSTCLFRCSSFLVPFAPDKMCYVASTRSLVLGISKYANTRFIPVGGTTHRSLRREFVEPQEAVGMTRRVRRPGSRGKSSWHSARKMWRAGYIVPNHAYFGRKVR
jgi:hypothetical protein